MSKDLDSETTDEEVKGGGSRDGREIDEVGTR